MSRIPPAPADPTWGTTMCSFDVPGIPVSQGSMRGFARGNRVILTSDNERLKPWRSVVSLAAAEAVERPFTGAVSLVLLFRLPVPRSAPKRRRLQAVKKPDVDKLARAVLDAMTGIVFVDDSQVVSLLANKDLAYDQAPGLTVQVFGGEAASA